MVRRAMRLRRGRLVLVCVLVLSLLGNAVTLGAVLRFRSLQSELLGDAGTAAFYPPPVRRALRDALGAQRDSLMPLLHAAAEARAGVVAAGTAEPFDRAATEAAMASFRASVDALLEGAQHMVLDTLEAEAAKDG
ncbi:periplasmic heavy metal sensor [Mangrovicoccus sp. HB161399]|uniref:periplasmic heavy metal sensor n=1 Tax=Mangrovicoccus sp. HB161399 TaxID=2720392 RepID=UPI0015534D72|nr:periplasmic heavy metal sensor [Mangrovicoccus sp. HB161399]